MRLSSVWMISLLPILSQLAGANFEFQGKLTYEGESYKDDGELYDYTIDELPCPLRRGGCPLRRGPPELSIGVCLPKKQEGHISGYVRHERRLRGVFHR